jgi:hypothetical protein
MPDRSEKFDNALVAECVLVFVKLETMLRIRLSISGKQPITMARQVSGDASRWQSRINS